MKNEKFLIMMCKFLLNEEVNINLITSHSLFFLLCYMFLFLFHLLLLVILIVAYFHLCSFVFKFHTYSKDVCLMINFHLHYSFYSQS